MRYRRDMTTERTLDWKANHDPKSWNFLTATALTDVTSRLWTLGNPVLDQGTEGACVGFGVTNTVSAHPVKLRLSHPLQTALGMYYGARRVDDFPGEAYSGTSVTAGCKMAVEMGFASGYRWAMGVEALALAILNESPAVIGVPWTEGMFTPDNNGLIHATGAVQGGHCVCVRGFNRHTNLFRIRQSWGISHGLNGDVFLSYADMDTILQQNGECAVLTK